MHSSPPPRRNTGDCCGRTHLDARGIVTRLSTVGIGFFADLLIDMWNVISEVGKFEMKQ